MKIENLLLPVMFALAGCTNNIENTDAHVAASESLTDQEKKVVRNTIRQIHLNLIILDSFIQDLDPLFDSTGTPITTSDNNHSIVTSMTGYANDLQWFLDNNKIKKLDRAFGGEDAPELTFIAEAAGTYTDTWTDDYIIVIYPFGWSSQGGYPGISGISSPGTLEHEASHYDFGGHSAILSYAIDEHLTDFVSFNSLVMDTRDFPYLTSRLMSSDCAGDILFVQTPFEEQIDTFRSANLYGNTPVERVFAHLVDMAETPFDDMVDEFIRDRLTHRTFREPDTYFSMFTILSGLGLTDDKASEDLEKIRRPFEEQAEWAANELLAMKTIYPYERKVYIRLDGAEAENEDYDGAGGGDHE